jgi:hypothetical protein
MMIRQVLLLFAGGSFLSPLNDTQGMAGAFCPLNASPGDTFYGTATSFQVLSSGCLRIRLAENARGVDHVFGTQL